MLWATWLAKQKQKQLEYDRYRVKKYINIVESRGVVVGDKFVLLVYNNERPELTYILIESSI